MKQYGFSYETELLDEPFENEQGTSFSRTAVVSVLNEDGRTYTQYRFGVLEKEKVYDWIEKGEEMQLDQCYVADFSIEQYRKDKKLTKDSLIELSNFSAKNAFFDGSDEVSFAYIKFTGDEANFTGAAFGGSSVSFYHSTFSTQQADFSEVAFYSNEVNFRFVIFEGKVLQFTGSKFFGQELTFVNSKLLGNRTDFSGIDFGRSNVRFQFTKFHAREVTFEKSKFEGKTIDFGKADFTGGKVDFRLCNFGDADVSFDECEFAKGKVRFRRATFGTGYISFQLMEFPEAELNFERASFGGGKVSFYESMGKALSFQFCHLNGYVDLRLNQCEKIDLSNSIVRDILDFNASDETTVRLGRVHFTEMRNLGKLYLDWNQNKVLDLIRNQTTTSNREKADQLRMLKEEFGLRGLYDDEDKAYLAFKRYELKYKTEDALAKSAWNAAWVYPLNVVKIIIFDKIGHYATNPARVLGSMFLTYFLFTLSYILIATFTQSSIESSIGEPEKLSLVAKSFYHSAITFLTIGYGDYYPSGFIRWLSSVEGFAGLFLMSYFTVAFVRKILR